MTWYQWVIVLLIPVAVVGVILKCMMETARHPKEEDNT